MGRADNPVRAVLNYASDHFLRDLPIVYVQTVVGARAMAGWRCAACSLAMMWSASIVPPN